MNIIRWCTNREKKQGYDLVTLEMKVGGRLKAVIRYEDCNGAVWPLEFRSIVDLPLSSIEYHLERDQGKKFKDLIFDVCKYCVDNYGQRLL